MLITPLQFLLVMLTAAAGAGLVQLIVRRRKVSRLRRLAASVQMHFSAADRFRLAPRIVALLPVPGAAAVRVADLIYGIERDHYRYVFATEYTTGVLRTKTSVRRVASYCEPRECSATARPPGELVFAPESLSLFEQYKHLLQGPERFNSL
ncbi:MAG: hypothetical protein ABIP55_16200 [Tepidisphaeraceae bacterium]